MIINDFQVDKVWLPPTDLQNEDVVPLGKEFVPTTSYTNIKNQAIGFNKILQESGDWAKMAPWNTVKHFEDLKQKEFQYNESRSELLKFYQQYGVVIPT